MTLYHASTQAGIKVLKPSPSTHKKAYVYATDNLVTALLFGAKHDDFDFLITTEGIPNIYECYRGAFKEKFGGKRCYVYGCDGEMFKRGVTGWDAELVSECETPVIFETEVCDLCERLQEEAKRGNLKIHFFSDDGEYKAKISEHIADRLVRFDLLKVFSKKDERGEKYFKKLIAALKRAIDGTNL